MELHMESQPQNPEVRNNPETFHPCKYKAQLMIFLLDCFLKKVDFKKI